MSMENPKPKGEKEKPRIIKLDKLGSSLKDSIPTIDLNKLTETTTEEVIEDINPEEAKEEIGGIKKILRSTSKSAPRLNIEGSDYEIKKIKPLGRKSIRKSEPETIETKILEKTKSFPVAPDTVTEDKKEELIKGLLSAHEEQMPIRSLEEAQRALDFAKRNGKSQEEIQKWEMACKNLSDDKFKSNRKVIDLEKIDPQELEDTIESLKKTGDEPDIKALTEVLERFTSYLQGLPQDLSQEDLKQEILRISSIKNVIDQMMPFDWNKHNDMECNNLYAQILDLDRAYHQFKYEYDNFSPSISKSLGEIAKNVHIESPKVEEKESMEKSSSERKEFAIDLAELNEDEMRLRMGKSSVVELTTAANNYIAKIGSQLEKLDQSQKEKEKYRIIDIEHVIGYNLANATEIAKDSRLNDEQKKQIFDELKIARENLRKLYKEIDSEKIGVSLSEKELSPEKSGPEPIIVEAPKGGVPQAPKEEILPFDRQIRRKEEEIERVEARMAIYRPIGWFRKKPVVRDLGYYGMEADLNKLKNELKELQKARKIELRGGGKNRKDEKEIDPEKEEIEERIKSAEKEVRARIDAENVKINKNGAEEKRKDEKPIFVPGPILVPESITERRKLEAKTKKEKRKIGLWKKLFSKRPKRQLTEEEILKSINKKPIKRDWTKYNE